MDLGLAGKVALVTGKANCIHSISYLKFEMSNFGLNQQAPGFGNHSSLAGPCCVDAEFGTNLG
jgi:hypothetical protein